MCILVSPPFTLTPGEVLHIRSYVWDVIRATDPDHVPGPASHRLRDHEIFPTTMQPFQLAAQRSIDDWHTWLSEAPPAPFKPAWSSKEEFEARAWEALESYPEMKGLGSACRDTFPHALITPTWLRYPDELPPARTNPRRDHQGEFERLVRDNHLTAPETQWIVR